jgi:glycosyltransferase involved in cell wall biosynthesis
MECPTLSDLPASPPGRNGWPWTAGPPESRDVTYARSDWPKISIVTPSYNQSEYIEQTIRSVLLQRYPNLEYIIIDGGSTDNSLEIIRRYEKWLAHWVSERDRGQSHAINKGFAEATGEVYNWLNSDDYLLRNALADVAQAYHGAPDVGAWCGACTQVDKKGKALGTRWPDDLDADSIAQWLGNHFSQSACFFSAEAWRRCGPLQEDLCFAMDLDLWLKIAADCGIGKVQQVLSVDHIHRDAKTQRGMPHMFAEICLVQIRHGYERYALRDVSRWAEGYLEMQRTGVGGGLGWIAGRLLGPAVRQFLRLGRGGG